MSYVIECNNLSRVYESYKKEAGLINSFKGFWKRNYISKVALAPTNLKIEGGQIIGLVGANGAGKTTLLKLLSGLIYPSSGEAKILGFNPWDRKPEFLRRISILLGQKNQLWWDIPAADSYDLLTRIYDIDVKTARARVQNLSEILKCQDQLHVQLRRLSLGERMKMEIIGALLHQPDVLFLDEPTIGLDIVAQTSIRNFLIEYVKDHRPTVILTSHYMDDISQLADRLLLISQGGIVYDGSVPAFLNRAANKQKLTLEMKRPPTTDVTLTKELVLKADQKTFEAEIAAEQMGEVLEKILSVSSVHDLKIEEVDFEEVIRDFLQKGLRHGPNGNRITT
jgi:ABC-2 type transport system ATP-binding protein